MPNFNFLKDSVVYIVTDPGTSNEARHKLDVLGVPAFSQTFLDKRIPQKTLHDSFNMFEKSNVKKANPADFEIQIPAMKEDDFDFLISLLLDYDTEINEGVQVTIPNMKAFDLYITNNADVYKLEKCVLTNGAFVIERLGPLSLRLTGQASKLTNGATLPTTNIQARTATTTYNAVKHVSISIDGVVLQNAISVGVELQNEIEWTDNRTVQDSIAVTNSTNTQYPSSYTLKKRSLAGSISEYLTSDNSTNAHTWKSDVPLIIIAGSDAANNFKFDINKVSFTNRIRVGDLFVMNYDWRMSYTPASLSGIITHNTTL
jgi:hypothetical protein|tara:strand:+ start:947 stop:1894 length:948 start_codon:yes stop_codon:yes gene_type:complete